MPLSCRLLGVSRSDFYGRQRRAQLPSDSENQREQQDLIQEFAKSSGHTYGSRRLVRVFNGNHKQPVFSSRLERNFKAEGPDHEWTGDIAYIWMQEG